MMRTLIILLLLLVIWRVDAHEDVGLLLSRDNVYCEFVTGWGAFRLNDKVDILLTLASKLSKAKGFGKEHVYIYFNHDYTKHDSASWTYGVGYMSRRWLDGTVLEKKKVLELRVRDRDVNIKQLLYLLNAGFEHAAFIRANQKATTIIKQDGEIETRSIVPTSLMVGRMATTDPVIEALLREMTFYQISDDRIEPELNFYYQDNKYHFYRALGEGKKVNDKTLYAPDSLPIEEVLVVDNFLEILGGVNDGNFVFINDSLFYFIPRVDNHIIGPFKVDSIRPGRPPVLKFYHEHEPVDRYTLFFSDYTKTTKALFFPDSPLLISNFHLIEHDFINGLLTGRIRKEEKEPISYIWYLVFSFGSLVIIFGFWLWKRHEPK